MSGSHTSFSPVQVRIHRGTFIDAAGERTGPWLYFIDYIEADGCECGMGAVASYYKALLDAQELADDAGGVPVVDMTDEVAR